MDAFDATFTFTYDELRPEIYATAAENHCHELPAWAVPAAPPKPARRAAREVDVPRRPVLVSRQRRSKELLAAAFSGVKAFENERCSFEAAAVAERRANEAEGRISLGRLRAAPAALMAAPAVPGFDSRAGEAPVRVDAARLLRCAAPALRGAVTGGRSRRDIAAAMADMQRQKLPPRRSMNDLLRDAPEAKAARQRAANTASVSRALGRSLSAPVAGAAEDGATAASGGGLTPSENSDTELGAYHHSFKYLNSPPPPPKYVDINHARKFRGVRVEPARPRRYFDAPEDDEVRGRRHGQATTQLDRKSELRGAAPP